MELDDGGDGLRRARTSSAPTSCCAKAIATTTERGQKMRQTGLAIISSMIQALPTVPLQATGYDLATGKPWDHIWLAPWLRNATEDMRVLMRAYRRERALGREHPEWFNWVKTYVDWLIQQQREDGSFPRRWKAGSNEVAEPSGTTSYCSRAAARHDERRDGRPEVRAGRDPRGRVRLGELGNPRALHRRRERQSEHHRQRSRDAQHGSLPESLRFDQGAASGWSAPRPRRTSPKAGSGSGTCRCRWMPTTRNSTGRRACRPSGFRASRPCVAGSADEYLDWAVPSYAKLYNLTKDQHYLDVARVLLHDTKSMVALPGRQYDMKGIGWQQEGWRMGPGGTGRGVGGHRFWLPWISANHLYGITGLEEYDPALFKRLSERPTSTFEPAAAQAHARVKVPAVPGEQAPPADPGQNNFGAPIARPGPTTARVARSPRSGLFRSSEISMSDPFVYPDEKSRTYYLVGSGGRLYKSKDLKTLDGPVSHHRPHGDVDGRALRGGGRDPPHRRTSTTWPAPGTTTAI